MPQDSENDNIIHQSLDITPHLTGSNYGAIGFKGNNNPQRSKYKFGVDNGFVSGKEYGLDFIIDNKDFTFYIIFDGALKSKGTIDPGRNPQWEIAYLIESTGDSMVLKNINTKYYNNTVTKADVAALCMTEVYAEIESIAVAGSTITTNTKFMGPTTDTNGTTKVLYALYDNAGMLAQLNVVNNAANLINGVANVQSFTIPDNAEIGDTLKVKAFMWNMGTLTPISNYSEATYIGE